MIRSIRTALTKIGGRRFDVCPLAMRHAPIPKKDYAEVLVDSGMQGRMFRALVNLAETPIANLRITNVSGFGDEAILFAAFAEAQEYRVVQRIWETVPHFIGWGIGRSRYAVERRSRIQNVNALYYLTPFHETEVVLTPEACDCCFDFAYLDYMKSCFDLLQEGSLLLLRFGPNVLYDYFKGPLVGWMSRAGFEETWLFGADKIKNWEDQKFAGKGFGLEGISQLSILSDPHVESNALFRDYKRQFILQNTPLMNNYLVFQRIAFPSVSAMRTLFLEVIEWEKAHMEERIERPPSRIERAREYLIKFSESLPGLLGGHEHALLNH